MAALRGFDRKFYFAYITKNATWGTLEAETALFPFRVNSEPLTITPEFADDTDLIGGNEEATLQDELARNVAGTISQNKARVPLMASLIAYGLGQSTDSTQDTSAGRHIITPYTTDPTVKTFSALDYWSSSYYMAYHNLAVDSFRLSTQRKGWVDFSAQVVGSGKHASSGITVGNLASALSATNLGPALKAGDAAIFRSVDAGTTVPSTYAQGTENLPGSATAITTKILDFSWDYRNNLQSDQMFEMGSGLYRARAERDRRSQEVSFTVELEDLTYLGYLTSQNTLAIEFQFTSGTLAGGTNVYFGLQVLFPKLLLTSAVPSGGTGPQRVACTGRTFYDGTNSTVRVTAFDKNTTGLLQ
jgi:hypothetical protein